MNRAAAIVPLALLATIGAGCSREPEVPQQEAPTAVPSGEPEVSPAEAKNAALERLIAFSDSKDCSIAESFVQLLNEIAPMDEYGRPATPFAPRISDPVASLVGTPALTSKGIAHEVYLPVDGDWHGLHLTGLTHWWTQESDGQGFSLHFANSPRQVIAALNTLEFDLPDSGKRVVPGELETFIEVDKEDGGAKLSCF